MFLQENRTPRTLTYTTGQARRLNQLLKHATGADKEMRWNNSSVLPEVAQMNMLCTRMKFSSAQSMKQEDEKVCLRQSVREENGLIKNNATYGLFVLFVKDTDNCIHLRYGVQDKKYNLTLQVQPYIIVRSLLFNYSQI